jgi:hypothetical protein
MARRHWRGHSDVGERSGAVPAAGEATELGIDLRALMSGRRPHVFRILFTFDAATVTVHRVRHAAQDRLTDDDI